MTFIGARGRGGANFGVACWTTTPLKQTEVLTTAATPFGHWHLSFPFFTSCNTSGNSSDSYTSGKTSDSYISGNTSSSYASGNTFDSYTSTNTCSVTPPLVTPLGLASTKGVENLNESESYCIRRILPPPSSFSGFGPDAAVRLQHSLEWNA